MILILGHVDVRPAHRAAMREAADAHVARSRREDGCLAHGHHWSDDAPDRLVFVEEWRDMQAVAAHFARPETRAFGEACAALGDGARIRIFDATLLREIGPG
ncbi:MAG: putative quinol monooxygenase [Lysobacteraceae bacterium]